MVHNEWRILQVYLVENINPECICGCSLLRFAQKSLTVVGYTHTAGFDKVGQVNMFLFSTWSVLNVWSSHILDCIVEETEVD